MLAMTFLRHLAAVALRMFRRLEAAPGKSE